MFFYSLKYKRIGGAAFAFLFLLLVLSQELSALEKKSKYALFEEPSVKLGFYSRDLKVGPGMNAAGKCLKGSEFVGQNLRGAVFDGCDLDDVLFYECDLSRASFRNACLTGARIEASGLDGADFSNAIVNGLGLTSSRLSEKQLKSTHSYKTKNLSQCVISGNGVYSLTSGKPLVKYDFRKANLQNAFLKYGDFSACDFTDARISGIGLSDAKITAEQLVSTQDYKKRRLRHMAFLNFLTFAHSPCAICAPVDFSGVDLTGTVFRGRPLIADFSDATITECSFDLALTKEQLCSTKNYREGNLTKIRLLKIDLSGCNFSGMNLSGCYFRECNFAGTEFDDAVISGSVFVDSKKLGGLTLEQIKSTWNYKHGRMAGIRLPEDIAKALEAEAGEKDTEKRDRHTYGR